MAARRLAISDLLCDEPNGPPRNPTAQRPVEQPPPRPLPTHLASILNDASGGTALRDNYNNVSPNPSSPHGDARDVVPLSLQPMHLRRHTPSPSLRRDTTPGSYAVLHAIQTHVGYDQDAYNETSTARSAVASTWSPEYDRVVAGRQQHSQVDTPHQLYTTRPHDLPTASYSSARPSSSRSAYSDSPTTQPFLRSLSYHPHPHSPSTSRSPSSVYSLPLPQRQPSRSPSLSARPVTASPVSYFHPPPTQALSYPSPHTHYDPIRSSLRGPGITGPSTPSMLFSGSPPSSFLPMSESRTSSLSHESPREIEGHPSAPSLPNILSSPSLRPNTGLGGLEALVQAATEERRRLSGELAQGLSRMDTSPKPNKSPVMERAPMQPPVVTTKPLSPFAVRTSSGGRREILNDDISTSPLYTRDSDGEPPRKRRKSSDAPNSYPSPMAIQQPITPCDVAVPASPTEVTQVLLPTLNDEETSTVVDDDLRTTSNPVAPHEAGGSTSDASVLEAPPAVGPQSRDETLEEQILDAVDGSPARAGEKDRVREKEDKMREKEKKREQKSREKRIIEQKHRAASVARETAENAGDQDAHEWLLEHYASTSPRVDPASSSSGDKAAASSTATAFPAPSSRAVKVEEGHRGRHHIDGSAVTRPSKGTKKARSRTPTPLAMLEEELDSVLPASHTIASSIEDELILDLASPTMASSVGGGVTDDNDLDVDNELLSLVDDVLPVPHTSRPKPTIIPKFDVHSRTKSSLSQPVSERGSMPPPASPVKDGGILHPPSIGDSFGGTSAVAGHKKKDPSQKPVPKPKAPPKPKSKVATTTTTKTKSKVIKDAIPSAPSLIPGMLTPSMSTSSAKGKKPTAASSANPAAKRSVSTAGGQSRSRSTSVMPTAPATEGEGKPTSEIADPSEVKEQTQDDKLYCICKTRYDEDRAMIACDRCDEWYHTQCVNMPELEIDLVDQFICPLCVRNNPHLRLQTTYKKRCFNGLKHPDPSSPSACHRPARGTYSKYCSDDCGILYMQARIHAWRGDKDSLWESVKNARKREGVVVLVKDASGIGTKATGNGHMSPVPSSAQPVLEVVKPCRPRAEREKERLNGLLDKVSCRRDELKKEMDVLLWREKLIELAVARAEQVDECGWDQRLCFGEEEYAEFGASVLESYEEADQSTADAMQMDGAQAEEGEWWCRGQKKCARHAGWQKLRLTEVDCDKEALDGVLSKLTTQEREIRKRIEDVVNPTARTSAADPTGPSVGSPLQHSNGKTMTNGHAKPKVNGDSAKKGKKKKT